MIALAMQRWNLHQRIALAVIAAIGIPGRLLLGFLVATAFISMWMSNTADDDDAADRAGGDSQAGKRRQTATSA
jgi:di/tricarboxylate transporter